MGLPFHPFWLINLAVIVGVLFALVYGALLLLRAVIRPGPTAAYGLRSPDGRHWWDGHQWQPVTPPSTD